MAQWHKFLCFIGGVTDHQALITGSDVKVILFQMNALSDVRGLFVYGNNYDGGLVIHTNIGRVVSDFLDSLSGDLLEVDFGLSADLSENHADGVLDGALTGDF